MEGVVHGVTAEGFSDFTSALPFPTEHLYDQSWGFSSTNLDGNNYSDSEFFTLGNSGVQAEEAWWDTPSNGTAGGSATMIMEDFLAKAAACGTKTAVMNTDAGLPGVEFASGDEEMTTSDGRRGKRSRSAVEELPEPVDKAAQQKERIMSKNRESAARYRQRERAYTMGLESRVTQLEQDNARLLKEEAESNKERYKKLMEYLIPVTESRKAPSRMTRVNSMEW